MERKILFATTNPYKKKRFQNYFKTLGLSVISFSDIQDKVEVIEDGKTPKENALKKATAGYNLTRIPTFGVDYWLSLEGFSEDTQPGPYVRRIFVGKDGKRVEANDEEMLKYYTEKIKALGGKTNGVWTSTIALVVDVNHIYTKSFTRTTVFVSNQSPKRTEGEPLNSIQIDPVSGKYFTDLTPREWLNLEKGTERGYITFMKKHLQEI
jgi:8-oxo-dGTP diphosphatase